MAIAPTLLPEYDHEMAGCRTALERVPAAQFGFKPHPKSYTLGQLANHLASVPSWLTTTLTTTELDFIDPATAARMPLPATTTDSLLAIFDQGVQAARVALAAASDADFMTIWTGKSHGKVLFAFPRIAVYRSFIMNHMIHHRAQLTVYLRLLDIPVPALYGPTADEG
jgi:uncharacterized damage-inducible protein DinB